MTFSAAAVFVSRLLRFPLSEVKAAGIDGSLVLDRLWVVGIDWIVFAWGVFDGTRDDRVEDCEFKEEDDALALCIFLFADDTQDSRKVGGGGA